MPSRFSFRAIATLVLVGLSALTVNPAMAEPTKPERIVGGTGITIESVPWQVALYDPSISTTVTESQFCGGTLINASWVLTAARCLDDYPTNRQLGVFAGSNNLGSPSRTYGRTSTRWILYPGFGHDTHDIALVKLSTPFDLSTDAVKAAMLPLDVNGSTVPTVGQDLDISGWGLTNPTNSLSAPALLRGATIDVLSLSSSTNCGSYSSSRWNPRYEMCIGVSGGGTDICERDTGGPLTARNIDGDGDLETESVLLGIASWGDGCGDGARPRFATRVSQYLDWIIPNRPTMTASYSKKTKSHSIKWVAPTNQLTASPVNGFRVEYSTNYGLSWKLAETVASTARTYSKKIAKDTLWRVAAVNDVNNGLGPYLWADTSGYVGDRALAVPSAPTNFTQSMSASGTTLRFKWAEPASTNGSAIYKYRFYRQFDNLAPMMLFEVSMFPGVTTEEAVKTLTVLVQRVGKQGKFWVTAVNNAGESPKSPVLTAG